MTQLTDLSHLTAYERTAWHESCDRLYRESRKPKVPAKVRELAGNTSGKVSEFAGDRLPLDKVKSIVDKTFSGTLELTFNPALRSASVESVLKGLQDEHPQVATVDDLRQLDLKHLDAFRRRKGLYVSASAAQGAATSLAVTGATVSATVSGGATAGVVVGAIAADAVASLAMIGRSVGSVAVRYGYDVRLPDEELFAMGVMSLGMANGLDAKFAAMSALSKLTQEMMRQATWKKLNEHLLVRVISRMYASLGLNLTKQKLAQTVPVVGVAINAGLNANMTKNAYQRAEDAYRLRFLSDRYGIDPQAWLAGVDIEGDESEVTEQLPDVAQILAEEQAALEAGGSDEPGDSGP